MSNALAPEERGRLEAIRKRHANVAELGISGLHTAVAVESYYLDDIPYLLDLVERLAKEREAAAKDIMRTCHTCAKDAYQCTEFEGKAFDHKSCDWQWRGLQGG